MDRPYIASPLYDSINLKFGARLRDEVENQAKTLCN